MADFDDSAGRYDGECQATSPKHSNFELISNQKIVVVTNVAIDQLRHVVTAMNEIEVDPQTDAMDRKNLSDPLFKFPC